MKDKTYSINDGWVWQGLVPLWHIEIFNAGTRDLVADIVEYLNDNPNMTPNFIRISYYFNECYHYIDHLGIFIAMPIKIPHGYPCTLSQVRDMSGAHFLVKKGQEAQGIKLLELWESDATLATEMIHEAFDKFPYPPHPPDLRMY